MWIMQVRSWFKLAVADHQLLQAGRNAATKTNQELSVITRDSFYVVI